MNINKSLQEYKKTHEYLKDIDIIYIPKDVENQLRKKKLVEELKIIHKDTDLAIEYCLLFLSNFSKIHFDVKSIEKWVALSSEILKKQIPGTTSARYRRVIDFLKSNKIIEVRSNDRGTPIYEAGVRSIQYRLLPTFFFKKLVKYTLTHQTLIKQRLSNEFSKIEISKNNIIVSNLLKAYETITLPTEEQIFEEAKRLVKAKYFNNKGKQITILNHKNKSKYKDFDKRFAYEDAINYYKFLIDGGLSFPVVGGENSGGRVYDSINMIPSFIRNLIKMDNENVVNVDLKCLHPNLAIKIYGGKRQYVTHQAISKELGIDVDIVKIEHLSFFNKHPKQMEKSQLFEYYKKHEPLMLDNLIQDKNVNKYQVTSKKMFQLEVEIMTKCLKKLNVMGIYPLYIFDALLINHNHQNLVEFVMNEVVKELGIYTIVGSHKSTAFIRAHENYKKSS